MCTCGLPNSFLDFQELQERFECSMIITRSPTKKKREPEEAFRGVKKKSNENGTLHNKSQLAHTEHALRGGI